MNSGFFLLVATLAFGFLSDVEHKALAQYFVSSLPSLTIPIGIWILYAICIMQFNIAQLRLPQNRFTYNLQFVPLGKRLFVTGAFFALQFLPAIAYATFLFLMSLQLSRGGSAAAILGTMIVSTAGAAIILVRCFDRPYQERRTSSLQRTLDRYYVRPVVQHYTEWLLRTEPLLIAGTKIFTGTLLFGICALYEHETYDMRLMAMGLTVCGMANMIVVFHLVKFEHGTFAWTKNLPLRLSVRFMRLLGAVVILLLPEFVILAKQFPDAVRTTQLAIASLYLVSLIAFFLGFLHVSAEPLEYHTRRSFWIFILLVVLILFKVPLIMVSLLSLATGYMFFSRYYYRFEPGEKNT